MTLFQLSDGEDGEKKTKEIAACVQLSYRPNVPSDHYVLYYDAKEISDYLKNKMVSYVYQSTM